MNHLSAIEGEYKVTKKISVDQEAKVADARSGLVLARTEFILTDTNDKKL